MFSFYVYVYLKFSKSANGCQNISSQIIQYGDQINADFYANL
jgi:hypothetical protein